MIQKLSKKLPWLQRKSSFAEKGKEFRPKQGRLVSLGGTKWVPMRYSWFLLIGRCHLSIYFGWPITLLVYVYWFRVTDFHASRIGSSQEKNLRKMRKMSQPRFECAGAWVYQLNLQTITWNPITFWSNLNVFIFWVTHPMIILYWFSITEFHARRFWIVGCVSSLAEKKDEQEENVLTETGAWVYQSGMQTSG